MTEENKAEEKEDERNWENKVTWEFQAFPPFKSIRCFIRAGKNLRCESEAEFNLPI